MPLSFAARSSWTALGALLVGCAGPWIAGARASMIAPGLVVDVAAAEWYSPWQGIGEQNTSSGAPNTDGIAGHVEASVTPNTGLTHASASAKYGGLGVQLGQNGLYSAGPGQLVKSQASGFASFRNDTVVVSEPGMGPGDTGSFTAMYQVDTSFVGEIAETLAGANAGFELIVSYHIEVLIGDLRPGFSPHEVIYTGQWSIDGDSGEVSEIASVDIDDAIIDFEYDQPLTIAAAVWSSMYLVGAGPGEAEIAADLTLGPTFRWMGVTDLPEPADLESDDGMDWKASVDIPSPGVLPIAALAGAAALSRRRSATAR